MYSFPDLEPVHCSMSSSNRCFLTYVQISQKAGKVVWYSRLLKNFPQFAVIHTVKCISVVNEVKVNVFSGVPLLFLWSNGCWQFDLLSSAFSTSSLYIWKLSVHVLLEFNLKDFEHYLASMWNECNSVVVWTFFNIVLLWDWNENWSFPVQWQLLSFPNLLAYWV